MKFSNVTDEKSVSKNPMPIKDIPHGQFFLSKDFYGSANEGPFLKLTEFHTQEDRVYVLPFKLGSSWTGRIPLKDYRPITITNIEYTVD